MSDSLTDEERGQAVYDEILAAAETTPQTQPSNSLIQGRGDGHTLGMIADYLWIVPVQRNLRPTAITGHEMKLLFVPRLLTDHPKELCLPAGAEIKLVKKQGPCTLVLSHGRLSMTLVQSGGKFTPWFLDQFSGFMQTGRVLVGKGRGAGPGRFL